jgi:hypothetical protein
LKRCGTTSVFTGVEKFRDELDIARSMLNIPSGPLPIGAGFLGWKLDEAGSQQVPLLELALENGVRAIWLSFGQDLGRWIEFVRNHDQKSGKSPKEKTLLFVQVNSVDDALFAVQAWKVDVLVAQGNNDRPFDPLALLQASSSSYVFPFFLTPFQESNREDTVQLRLHQSSISFLRYCPPFPPQEPHPCSQLADSQAVGTSRHS